jgi:regulator of sigma D
MQTAMENTARLKFQLATLNGTLDQLDPTTRTIAEAMGWYSQSLDEVATAQSQVISEADTFNRWADSVDGAMSQVANKAQIVAATLRGIRYEEALMKNSELMENSTASARETISKTFGKEVADSGIGRFATNVLGFGMAVKTTAEVEAARERSETSISGAENWLRDLNKPGKGGGGLSKDDFNDISKYAGESTRVTLEYKRAMDELNEAAAKHPELIKEAGGLQKVQMEMTAKYHRDLQQALETERSIQWDDKYLTVEKKVRDIVNGVKELTPLEEAVNEKYEIRRQLFILLGDSDKGRKATAEAILAIEEKTNRLMSERSASMADKYTGSKYGAVQEVESDIRSLNRDQSSLMTDIVGGNFSAAADYARNAATLVQMNQQLKIAQLESTKLGQAFSTSADAIGSALTDLVMNGKMDVRGLITTILNEFFKLLVIEPLIQQLKSAMGEWLGGSSGGGGFNFLNPLSWFGFGHTGGMVSALPHPRKYHSGGIVPRGGVSTHGLRSWEKMTQVPKGSEIIKEHDRRHSNMMPVILKAGEEVLPPWDSRNFASKYHTGGMVGYADPQAMVNDGKNYAAKSPSNDNRPVGGGITIHNENKITFQGVAPRSDTGDATKLATKIGEHIAEESNKSSRIASVKMMVNTRNMKMA